MLYRCSILGYGAHIQPIWIGLPYMPYITFHIIRLDIRSLFHIIGKIKKIEL